MSEITEFEAEIKAADRCGAYVVIPFDVEDVYGRKRVKVKATFDGEPYRGSLVRMGESYHAGARQPALRAASSSLKTMLTCILENAKLHSTWNMPRIQPECIVLNEIIQDI